MATLVTGPLMRHAIVMSGVPNMTKRLVSYRKSCKFFEKAKCDQTELKKTTCYKDIQEGRVLPDHPLREFWDKPECCDDPCAESYVRFDDIYYFISDKAKRKYTRTWNECPKTLLRCKKVCCIKETSPPFVKRPKNAVIDTACPGSDNCVAMSGPCPKIKMPGCKTVRATLKCRIEKRPPCDRFCAPYPSYSECQHPTPKPKHPVECSCLSLPMQCELVGLKLPEKKRLC